MMHWIWVLIVGAIIGAIAGAITNQGKSMGCITNIIAGLIGSSIGQALLGLMGTSLSRHGAGTFYLRCRYLSGSGVIFCWQI